MHGHNPIDRMLLPIACQGVREPVGFDVAVIPTEMGKERISEK